MTELIKTKRQSSAVQSARVERILEIATDNEIKKVESNFTYLATIGSTAPFIGLFGTVWGIMNSFSVYSNIEEYKLSNCSTRYSRGVVCYCTRTISCHTSSCCI